MKTEIKTQYAKSFLCFSLIAILVCSVFTGCSTDKDITDYSEKENWAFFEEDKADTKADVFFISPTAYSGNGNGYNMSLDDEKTKKKFFGATNMEKGIYDAQSRFFAPYYRQIGMSVYKLEDEEQKPYLETAYKDIKAAFRYYLKNVNNGRPIILAGFSQGAYMCIRLLKDCFKDKSTNELLVACYAIGWSVTEQEMKDNPHLKFAEGENDTGVIVSFNSEAENVSDSLMIPQGTKTLAINPLNWKTDGTKADKSQNMGACFTDYSGNVKKEIKNLTGAYIDSIRGALKVTDVTPEDYPAGINICEDGVYHIYDYQFFYRNLQENVANRLNAYLSDNR